MNNQPATGNNEVAEEHFQLATTLLLELGGKENIIDVQAHAISRLRLELKSLAKINEAALKKAGVTHVMKINDGVIHLLIGDQAAGTEQAMKTLLV